MDSVASFPGNGKPASLSAVRSTAFGEHISLLWSSRCRIHINEYTATGRAKSPGHGTQSGVSARTPEQSGDPQILRLGLSDGQRQFGIFSPSIITVCRRRGHLSRLSASQALQCVTGSQVFHSGNEVFHSLAEFPAHRILGGRPLHQQPPSLLQDRPSPP